MSIWRYSWALLGGLVGQCLGGWDGFLICLTTFVVIDYLTGFLAAAQQQRLSSARGCRGIVKKILIFIVIGMGHLLDTILLGGAGEPLRSAMIFFYLANEGLSILENLTALGVPIPQRLKQVLAGLGAEDTAQIPKNSRNDSGTVVAGIFIVIR